MYPTEKVDKAAAMIWNAAETHGETWQEEPNKRWWWGLIEEIVELSLALIGRHRHRAMSGDVIEHELIQIGSIALNWLRKRYRETDEAAAFRRHPLHPWLP